MVQTHKGSLGGTLVSSKIDLATRNATELAFDADLPMAGVARLIDALQTQNITPARPNLIAFEEIYEVSNTAHSARAWLELNDGQVHLSVRYRVGTPIAEIAGGLTVAELLRQTEVVKDSLRLQCRASFVHSCDTHVPFYPLPQSAGPEAQGLYDEIRGIRLAKTEGGETVYEVVLDQPDNDTIHDSVTFVTSEQLGPDLPVKLLDIAAEVSLYFVRPTGR